MLVGKGVPAETVRVVPPGFDGPDAPELPERSEGPPRALCVAQWIPRKSLLDLVRAWKAADRRGSMLDLVGETDADPDYAFRVREAALLVPPVNVPALCGALDLLLSDTGLRRM